MRITNRSLRSADFVLVLWLLPATGLVGVAQEFSPSFPNSANSTTSLLPERSATGFRLDETPQSDSSTLSFGQRIAQLASGRSQIEGGYSLLYDKVDGEARLQHAFPDMLLRFGLTDRLELRLGWPGYVSSDFDSPVFDDESSAVLNPNVGLAYDLWSQHGLIPRTAVLAAVPVTLEGSPFALNSLQPLTEVMYGWDISDRTAITGRTGFALFDVAGDRFTQLQQTCSLDVLLTERLGTFVSWEMLVDHGSANDAIQHMGSGGLSFQLTENLSVSWRAGVGLNSDAPDFVNDVRFAYRF